MRIVSELPRFARATPTPLVGPTNLQILATPLEFRLSITLGNYKTIGTLHTNKKQSMDAATMQVISVTGIFEASACTGTIDPFRTYSEQAATQTCFGSSCGIHLFSCHLLLTSLCHFLTLQMNTRSNTYTYCDLHN